MKTSILFLGIITVLAISCKRTEINGYYNKQPDYEYINNLSLTGDVLWVVSSKPDYVLSFVAIIPPYQVSKINLKDDKIMTNDEIPGVSSMVLDRDNQPYLATFDKRILKLNPDLSYKQYIAIPKSNSIQKMIFDQFNNLWVATGDQGLFFYNGTDTLRFNTANSILTSNSIESMGIDSESNIWFIQGSGLFKIDKNKTISKDQDILPLNNLAGAFNLSIDKNNTLWVSKWDGNFHRIFKKSLNSHWTIIDPPKSSDGKPVKFIKSDINGTIWIAYSDYPKDVLAYYDSNKWNEVQIPLDEVVILDVVTYKNELILGTSKGIYTMNF
jgi:hypothetical protein